jgi:hypothetical protein
VSPNYCIVCPGELNQETEAREWASYPTGRLYCTECSLMYKDVPPEYLQKRPVVLIPAEPLEITWKGENI